MYGMKPKARLIERVLETLVEQPEGGMVVVSIATGFYTSMD